VSCFGKIEQLCRFDKVAQLAEFHISKSVLSMDVIEK
jgi:hypothetical protein